MKSIFKESSNPMFSDYMVESVEEESGVASCSYLGIFGKTFFLCLVAIVSGLVCLPFIKDANVLIGMLIGASILGFICAIAGRFTTGIKSGVFGIIYSACEGLLLGAVTLLCEALVPGIAFAAVASTIGVVLIMAFLYMTGIVKVGHKFKAFMLTCASTILLVNLIVIIAMLCGNRTLFDAFYGTSIFGLVVTILVVLFAAFSLLIDFDFATNLVQTKSDKKYEWNAAIGLMVSIVYIYIQILRLLLIIAARSKR